MTTQPVISVYDPTYSIRLSCGDLPNSQVMLEIKGYRYPLPLPEAQFLLDALKVVIPK